MVHTEIQRISITVKDDHSINIMEKSKHETMGNGNLMSLHGH